MNDERGSAAGAGGEWGRLPSRRRLAPTRPLGRRNRATFDSPAAVQHLRFMDAQRGIARRMVIGLPAGGFSPAWERDFASYPPAGVLLFRRDFRDLEDLRRITKVLRDLARPRRLFLAIDEEGGHVSQLAPHFVVPPNALLLARGAERDDLETVARVTGTRLRALGLDWVFAPVADIHSEPRNPVIGPRAFGTTPEQVSEALSGILSGFRAAGIASCLKHFPGHGDTALDSHLALPVNALDRDGLERRELAPFRAHRDADAVMTAHVVYPAFDAARPASRSTAITHDLLRTGLGFEGLCITDALEMKGASADGLFGAACGALEAGADLLLFAFFDDQLRRVRLELARAIEAGAIERTHYDAARPRLEAFALAHSEPTLEELGAPLASLTPADWTERLERIVDRGLIVRGAAPRALLALPWRVVRFGPEGPTPLGAELEARGLATAERDPGAPPLADELRELGVRLAEEGARTTVAVVASRTPLPAGDLDRLRALCRAGPTVAVGLQNDAFLDEVPEAALRISAADSTPLTRRVVAKRLAQIGLAP